MKLAFGAFELLTASCQRSGQEGASCESSTVRESIRKRVQHYCETAKLISGLFFSFLGSFSPDERITSILALTADGLETQRQSAQKPFPCILTISSWYYSLSTNTT